MTDGFLDLGTKDEQARHNSQRAGRTYQHTLETQARWREREKRDEETARSVYGMSLSYDEVRA